MSIQKLNYYRILQIDPAAEPEVVDGAYRRLAKKYHPDTSESNGISPNRMQLINEAYEVLIDPEKRAQYDREMLVDSKIQTEIVETPPPAQSTKPVETPVPAEQTKPVETPPPVQQTKPVETPIPTAQTEIIEEQPPVEQSEEMVPVITALEIEKPADIAQEIAVLTPQTQMPVTGTLMWLPTLVVAVVLIALLVVAGIVIRNRFFSDTQQAVAQENITQPAASDPAQQVDLGSISLAPITPVTSATRGGIARFAMLHTTIPTRPRVDVIKYTVQLGDTLFVIADKFGLKPETLLWGNYDVLEDNPHLLKPDQELVILPVNGTYYKWAEGDTLSKVATFFKVEPNAILEYTGNRFDLTVSTVENPGIEVGTMLIIPGGKRAIKDWGPPAISRANPASAASYGPGSCGKIYEGAIGTGSFVWPSTEHFLSGYGYDPGVHPAIDIAGQIGNAVFAADSGVVVYSGWSNYGYGNLLVIDHGNGWQTAYAHLNSLGAGCGQSVLRGGVVATLGSTGNSTGAHLHFEMIFNGAKVNPRDFVQ